MQANNNGSIYLLDSEDNLKLISPDKASPTIYQILIAVSTKP